MLRDNRRIKTFDIEAIVTKIDVLNKQYENKFKTAFYCKPRDIEKEVLCIYWQKSTIQEGDSILLSMYRISKTNAFIVTRLSIYKRANSETEETQNILRQVSE